MANVLNYKFSRVGCLSAEKDNKSVEDQKESKRKLCFRFLSEVEFKKLKRRL